MAKITVSSRHGAQTIETGLTLAQAAAVIAGKANRSGFENDLLSNYGKWGDRLTSGRRDWMLFLAQQHLDRARQPKAPTIDLGGNFAAIQELFGRVAGKLKFPRFRLQTADGRPVVLQIAGHASKNAGTVSVTTGEPFGTPGSFYGRINLDGTTTVKDAGVIDLLREFAADPAGTAAAYGKLTGNCCFCKTPLTDARSLHQGYGPKCADNYGLPWGDRPTQGELPLASQKAEKALPPWNAPEPVETVESPAEAKEEALVPLTVHDLLLGCSDHLTAYDAMPLFVL